MPLLPVLPPFCAIAPTDQSATQLGWHFGDFTYGLAGSAIAGSRTHQALDFLADVGTPIVVPFGGFVTHVSQNDGAEFGDRQRGFHVTILHPPAGEVAAPHFSTYLHLAQRTPLRAGQFVEAGALLGRVGRSGLRATDRPRLELRVARAAASDPWSAENHVVDPLLWFSILGLRAAGAEPQTGMLGGRAPNYGGRLLVQTRGPSDCVAPIRGLGAPAGFEDPRTSVYDQYGPSANSSTAEYTPTLAENRNIRRAAAGGILALGIATAIGWSLLVRPK